ncbi:MAG: uncharacterized membrane protein YbhN (UPF0104 family) [Myxococcota bacterium]|jgi:uncharacterized membrane protein YbhN (UPF0104 family)
MEPSAFDADRARSALRKGTLSIGLGVVLLVLVLWGAARTPLGAEALGDLLSSSRPGYLVASWLIISLAFYFMALRWRSLMPPPHHPPSMGLASIICAGLLLNYAVPGPFGELGAAWFAHKRYRVPFSDALATGVAARLIGLATAALMALVIWAVVDLPPPAEQGEVLQRANELIPVAALAIGAGGVTLFWLALKPSWWRQLSARTLGQISGTGRIAGLAAKLDGAIGAVAGALARTASRGLGAYARTAGWALMGHTSVIIGIMVAAHGLGAEANLAGLAFTYAATTAGAVALFAFPASQIGWDLMFFSLLVAAAGLPAPVAAAIAVLVRLQQLSMMVLGAMALSWLLQRTAEP